MKKLILITSLFIFFLGCKEKPTYELIIGERTFQMPVHEDSKKIQNEIIAKVKPLWDGLVESKSEVFFTRRVLNVDFDELDELKSTYGSSMEFTSTCTTSTPKSRFFKNRKGISGMEQVSEDDTADLILGEDVRWNSIEYYLRNQIFDTQTIDRMIKQHSEKK